MGNKLTYVIILNWNGLRDTIDCVDSVKKLQPPCNIIIVDNGSTDGSEAVLRERFPDIELIQTGENLGFADGNNVGIRRALAQGAEYVILLNNDTIVDVEFASQLVAAASADPSVGMASSKIYFYSSPDIMWYAGATLNLRTGHARHIGYGQKDTGQYDGIKDTDRACGCAMLITRQMCEQAGLLDAAYFCYSEDSDWSVRARKAGFRVVFVPGSKVWHKISASTGGVSTGNSLYYLTRNNLLLVNRHEPLAFPFSVLRDMLILGRMICSLFTLRIHKISGFKMIVLGTMDYYRGKFGCMKKQGS